MRSPLDEELAYMIYIILISILTQPVEDDYETRKHTHAYTKNTHTHTHTHTTHTHGVTCHTYKHGILPSILFAVGE